MLGHINELIIWGIQGMHCHKTTCDLGAADIRRICLFVVSKLSSTWQESFRPMNMNHNLTSSSHKQTIESWTTHGSILNRLMDTNNEPKINAKIPYFARGASHCKHYNYSCKAYQHQHDYSSHDAHQEYCYYHGQVHGYYRIEFQHPAESPHRLGEIKAQQRRMAPSLVYTPNGKRAVTHDLTAHTNNLTSSYRGPATI